MSFESGAPSDSLFKFHPAKTTTVDELTKSTASGLSRDKQIFPEATPPFAKRHRQTEAINRSRFAEIFNPTHMDKLSFDNGFCPQVFTAVPLCEDDGEEIVSPMLFKADFLNGGSRVRNLVLKQQESTTEPLSPLKSNLKHITNLLDDDDECFYKETMQ